MDTINNRVNLNTDGFQSSQKSNPSDQAVKQWWHNTSPRGKLVETYCR